MSKLWLRAKPYLNDPATEGDVNGDAPAPFDFVAKAKYEAWSGNKGKSREAAMKEYVQLVDKLKA